MNKFLLSFYFLFYTLSSNAQVTAFPGAEGAGKNTTGGRGTISASTTVFAVTSLLDDGTTTKVGTLRWALNASATYRTIIFRVSGTIHLAAALKITKPNTTIAGQSAPGDGICIADYPVSVSADNVIVRYIRFRMGDKNQNLGKVNFSGNDDAFDGTGRNMIVIDHCTMSWSDDEACSFYRCDSMTLQWNFITEPLNYSYHFETGDTGFEHHGYGGIWGGQHATFHHNLIAHCQGRAPRFDGSRNLGDGATVGLENADFVNNVIYNWGNYNTNGGEGGNYNVVNNYYKYGPSTSHGTSSGVKITQEVINPGSQTSPALPYGQYYLSGNYVDAASAVTADNWKGASFSGGSLADSATSKVTVPFTIVPIQMQTAADAYNSVLSKAGCSLPNRDTLDQRIVNDVINRSGRIIDVQGGYPHGTAYALTVNAWPTLHSLPAPVTTNKDSIPNEWLVQRKLTGQPLSGSGGYHSNGYTHIENFLNGDSIVAFGKINNCVAPKKITSLNSGNWIDAKDTTYTRLISTDTNNVVASILDNSVYGDFQVSYFTTGTMRYDANNHPYLNRNITITPVSVIPSSVSVRVYFTKDEFDALKAVDPTIQSLSDLNILKVPDNTCPSSMSGVPEVIVPTGYGTYGTYQTGYFLEFTTTSFSTFFVGSKVYFTVPVKLTSFSAAILNNANVKLTWGVQNDMGLKNFVVEKSLDGQSFHSLMTIDANNHLSGNYSASDMENGRGIVFYRLKLVNEDGTFSYSNIISVSFRNDIAIGVYPNPAKDKVIIDFPTSHADLIIKIMSVDGRNIYQSSVKANLSSFTIDISSFAKGMYLLISSDRDTVKTIKFVKQ